MLLEVSCTINGAMVRAAYLLLLSILVDEDIFTVDRLVSCRRVYMIIPVEQIVGVKKSRLLVLSLKSGWEVSLCASADWKVEMTPCCLVSKLCPRWVGSADGR